MFVWCEGGPAIARTVVFPPPSEFDAEGGLYVLVDEGEPATWRYEFVAEPIGLVI